MIISLGGEPPVDARRYAVQLWRRRRRQRRNIDAVAHRRTHTKFTGILSVVALLLLGVTAWILAGLALGL